MTDPTNKMSNLKRHKSVQLKNMKQGTVKKKKEENPQQGTHHVNPIIGHIVNEKFDDGIKDEHEDDFQDGDFDDIIVEANDSAANDLGSQFSVLAGITALFFVLFIVFAALYGMEKHKLIQLETAATLQQPYKTKVIVYDNGTVNEPFYYNQTFIQNNIYASHEYVIDTCEIEPDSDVPDIYRGHNIFTTSYYGVPITLHLYYGANAYKYQDVIVIAPPFGKFAPNAYQILQEQVHLAEALNSLVVVPDFSQTGWTYTEQVLGNLFNQSNYNISGQDWQAIINGDKSSYSYNFDIRLKTSAIMNPTQQWTLGVYPYIFRLARRFISHHYSEMNWVLYGYGSTGSLTAQLYGLFYTQMTNAAYEPSRIVLEPSDWYIFPIQPAINTSFFGNGSTTVCDYEEEKVNSIFTYNQTNFFDSYMTKMEDVLDSLNVRNPIEAGNMTLNATACMVALGAAAFSQPLNQTLIPNVTTVSGSTVKLSPASLCENIYTNIYTGDTSCASTYSSGNAGTYAPFPYGIGNLKGIATAQKSTNSDASLGEVLDFMDSYTGMSKSLVATPFKILINEKMTNKYGGYGASYSDNQCDPSQVVFPLPSNSALDNQGAYQLARATNFFLSGQWFANYYNKGGHSDSIEFNWDYFYCAGLGYNSGKQPHCPSTWMAVTGSVEQLNSYWMNPRYGQPYFHFQTYNITLQTQCCSNFWVDTGYLESCQSSYNCEYSGPGRSLNQTLVNILAN